MTPTVAIGYVHGDTIRPAFMESVINLICYATDEYKLGTVITSAGVILPTLRNNVVRRFNETDCDWLLFLDTDVQFAPDTLETMVKAARGASLEILAAPYWTHPIDGEHRLTWHDDELKPGIAIPPAGLLQLGACGMGCTLIHRKVFDTIRRERLGSKDDWLWFGHDLLPSGERAGEDVTFCLRARAAGFTVWGLAEVVVEHHKVTKQPRRIMTEADQLLL